MSAPAITVRMAGSFGEKDREERVESPDRLSVEARQYTPIRAGR
jgi:hypothetical protein